MENHFPLPAFSSLHEVRKTMLLALSTLLSNSNGTISKVLVLGSLSVIMEQNRSDIWSKLLSIVFPSESAIDPSLLRQLLYSFIVMSLYVQYFFFGKQH